MFLYMPNHLNNSGKIQTDTNTDYNLYQLPDVTCDYNRWYVLTADVLCRYADNYYSFLQNGTAWSKWY